MTKKTTQRHLTALLGGAAFGGAAEHTGTESTRRGATTKTPTLAVRRTVRTAAGQNKARATTTYVRSDGAPPLRTYQDAYTATATHRATLGYVTHVAE